MANEKVLCSADEYAWLQDSLRGAQNGLKKVRQIAKPNTVVYENIPRLESRVRYYEAAVAYFKARPDSFESLDGIIRLSPQFQKDYCKFQDSRTGETDSYSKIPPEYRGVFSIEDPNRTEAFRKKLADNKFPCSADEHAWLENLHLRARIDKKILERRINPNSNDFCPIYRATDRTKLYKLALSHFDVLPGSIRSKNGKILLSQEFRDEFCKFPGVKRELVPSVANEANLADPL